MEEKKKFDLNTLVGFLLIGGILLYMMYLNKQEPPKKSEQKAETQTESVSKTADSTAFVANDTLAQTATDSTTLALNSFAGNAGLNDTTTLENKVLELKVSNKGGQIVEAKLKGMTNFHGDPIYLIKNGNASLGLDFLTVKNKKLNTANLYFKPSLSHHDSTTVLSMRLTVAPGKYLEYRYSLTPHDYMMGFAINSHGLKGFINQQDPVNLNWKLKAYRHGRSVSFESRYTKSIWYYEGNKTSSQRSDGKDSDKNVSWVAYRQHFFSSILMSRTPFAEGTFHVKDLVKEEEKDTTFTKAFATTFPLTLKNGEIQENLNLFYGPSKYKLLKTYDHHLEDVVPLGWGIFGWINKYLFIPILNFLLKFFPAGIAIILMTVIVKIALSPVQYKQYVMQAKRKVIQPEIEAINEKFKDKMKRQQETMKLNKKAGIGMTSGCLFGLLQAPLFYALYELFPAAFNLRHKSFLWVDDLSSYEVIFKLPFNIPFYGDHVSIFPILASIAIFFYMMLTTGQTMVKQPGMPNMKFIMYLSPLFMLFFFNSYPSGLSLYYFTSNLISVCIILVIQHYIIDEEKIHAQIQENKKKPVKQSRFQRKMQEMMEEAERQKRAKK